MNILVFYPGGSVTETSQQLLTLLTKLQSVELTVTVVLLKSGDLKSAIEQAGIEVILVTQRGPFNLFFYWALLKITRKLQTTVIHLHGAFSLWKSICKLAQQLKIPTLAYLPEQQTPEKIMPELLRMVDRIVVSSHNYLKRLPEETRNKLIYVIYPGIDIQLFYPQAKDALRQELQISDPKSSVIGIAIDLNDDSSFQFLTGLQPALIRGGLTSYIIVIINEDRESHQLAQALLKKVQQNGLADTLKIITRLNCNARVLSGFDLLLNCAEQIGSQLLIKAAACGNPLIALKLGVNEEIIEHGVNGLLLRTKSLEEISACIFAILSESETRRFMSLNSRLIVENKFNQDNEPKTLARLYKTMTETG